MERLKIEKVRKNFIPSARIVSLPILVFRQIIVSHTIHPVPQVTEIFVRDLPVRSHFHPMKDCPEPEEIR